MVWVLTLEGKPFPAASETRAIIGTAIHILTWARKDESILCPRYLYATLLQAQQAAVTNARIWPKNMFMDE